MPNPSLKLTRYGMRCKPGPRHMVHHRSPGLQRTPHALQHPYVRSVGFYSATGSQGSSRVSGRPQGRLARQPVPARNRSSPSSSLDVSPLLRAHGRLERLLHNSRPRVSKEATHSARSQGMHGSRSAQGTRQDITECRCTSKRGNRPRCVVVQAHPSAAYAPACKATGSSLRQGKPAR